MSEKVYLTEEEVADRLTVKVSTVRGWRLNKKGPPYLKLEGAVRYRPEDVEAYIAAARVVHE